MVDFDLLCVDLKSVFSLASNSSSHMAFIQIVVAAIFSK
jgi:hypothetical protein